MANFDPATVAAAATIAQTNLSRRVLHRLGDSDEKVWTMSEVDSYLPLAVSEMALRTRVMWDRLSLDDLMALTGQTSTPPPAVVVLPVIFTEIERATGKNGPIGQIEALSPRDLAQADSRYEITTGEVFGYTLRKDGPRTMRLIRVPPTNPIGVNIDYWRTFEATRDLSELPNRYFLYLADYMQWRCLTRSGPGQDFKLAQLYKNRWERGLERIIDRLSKIHKDRVGRLGGTDTSDVRSSGPPRPKLPWQYGSRYR